jgi:transcriptional regulator with XRE-family HTH domain
MLWVQALASTLAPGLYFGRISPGPDQPVPVHQGQIPVLNADPFAFGRAVARLRHQRGFTQQEVAARISTYYSDAGAYGRIERGERRADRHAAIAILVQGLLILDIAEINDLLKLAEYQALGAEDFERFGLARPEVNLRPEPETAATWWRDWHTVRILSGSLVLSGLAALSIPQHALFALLTSFLYAALYAVSLYLESAFEPKPATTRKAAVRTFGFVAVSSTVALATDRILINTGNPLALLSALVIFLCSAIVQFFIARHALPETAIVPATFQTRTAQSAHLKNTGYFLLIVVVFWLPPFHGVLTCAREIREGHADWVRQVLAQPLMLGRGVLTLSVPWLLGLLLITFLISLYMAYCLLDKLQPHPRLNSFTILFYLRALLYFVLCLSSIGWFAFSLGELA